MTKQKKLRHLEYYDLQETFDNLYAKSKQGRLFTNLMELISSEENIRLAYRNIKRNAGSITSGVDGKTINPRYTFRCWLIRIGLNGDEFKNCRKHLLSHLEGNIAWLHPEDAIKQRERLKAERIAAREQRVEPVREIQTINDNVPDEISEPTVSECEEVVEYEDYEQEETFEMSM